MLIFVSSVTGCVSISSFASLVCVPVGVKSSVVETKICAITGGIQNYKEIIKRKKKKYDETVLLGKGKLNIIEVLICKSLIDSWNERRNKILCVIFYIKKWQRIASVVRKILRPRILVSKKLNKID